MAAGGGSGLSGPGGRCAAVLGAGAAALAMLPHAATAGQAEWSSDLRGPVASAIIDYYSRAHARPDFTPPDCLSDEGHECFGGDHEDQRCRRVPRCRDEGEIDAFLGRLAQAARVRADDAHAVAQAVYAFSRLRRHGAAAEIAGACAADAWWCALVRGMALHRSGRSTEAEAAFRAALPEADSALYCRLTGIEALLVGHDRDVYKRLEVRGSARIRGPLLVALRSALFGGGQRPLGRARKPQIRASAARARG